MHYREAGQHHPTLLIVCMITAMSCLWPVSFCRADDEKAKPTPTVTTEKSKQPTDATPQTLSSTPSTNATTPNQSPPTTDKSESKSDPLTELPTYGAALIRMVVALVSILIALLILAKLLPRWLNRSLGQKGNGDITVVDSIQLEPRRRVFLLRVGGRNVLIGSSEQGLHTLVGEMPNGKDNADENAGDDGGAAIVESRHQPSSLATPFESVMKSKDGPKASLRGNA